MASCCRRLIQPARMTSNKCHGWSWDFMFLRMRAENPEHPGSAGPCQASEKGLAWVWARAVISATCGSAEFFYPTAIVKSGFWADCRSLDKAPEMDIMASLTPKRRDLWNL
jgi:hypothetical protein